MCASGVSRRQRRESCLYHKRHYALGAVALGGDGVLVLAVGAVDLLALGDPAAVGGVGADEVVTGLGLVVDDDAHGGGQGQVDGRVLRVNWEVGLLGMSAATLGSREGARLDRV